MNGQLKASWDEDGVALRLQGLSWLAPVTISLDRPDVPVFVYEPMTRAAMKDQFAAFGAQLQRLAVAEISPALERIVLQILTTPVAAPTNDFEAEVQQLEYDQFLLNAGKGEQLRKEQAQRDWDAAAQKEVDDY